MTLSTYLLASALLWSPPRQHADETPEAYGARLGSIADDVAAVAQDEEPTFTSPDPDRSRTAALLLAVAFFESGFQRYVDKGDCNDDAWRRAHPLKPSCDGGQAVSLWQIHPAEGIVLLATDDPAPGPDWSRAFNFSDEWRADPVHAESVIGTSELLSDRRLAARVALHMIRRSLRGGDLRGFTGEQSDPVKARSRLDFARAWSARHPFDVNSDRL